MLLTSEFFIVQFSICFLDSASVQQTCSLWVGQPGFTEGAFCVCTRVRQTTHCIIILCAYALSRLRESEPKSF
jgi:hypothetical protein